MCLVSKTCRFILICSIPTKTLTNWILVKYNLCRRGGSRGRSPPNKNSFSKATSTQKGRANSIYNCEKFSGQRKRMKPCFLFSFEVVELEACFGFPLLHNSSISPIKTFLGPPSVHDASTVGLCKRHKGPQMTLSQTKDRAMLRLLTSTTVLLCKTQFLNCFRKTRKFSQAAKPGQQTTSKNISKKFLHNLHCWNNPYKRKNF